MSNFLENSSFLQCGGEKNYFISFQHHSGSDQSQGRLPRMKQDMDVIRI